MSSLLDLCVFELAGHKVAIPLENAREFQRLPEAPENHQAENQPRRADLAQKLQRVLAHRR